MTILSRHKNKEQLPQPKNQRQPPLSFWYVTIPLILLMGNAWIIKTSACGAYQRIKAPGFNYEAHSGRCEVKDELMK
ncbi:hypothetical protein B4U84_29680 [Westiellopsis prolifica IICB1]|nr:hypothetical protein B4U84_29680 [Westiellopsis prolifica IICB1]